MKDALRPDGYLAGVVMTLGVGDPRSGLMVGMPVAYAAVIPSKYIHGAVKDLLDQGDLLGALEQLGDGLQDVTHFLSVKSHPGASMGTIVTITPSQGLVDVGSGTFKMIGNTGIGAWINTRGRAGFDEDGISQAGFNTLSGLYAPIPGSNLAAQRLADYFSKIGLAKILAAAPATGGLSLAALPALMAVRDSVSSARLVVGHGYNNFGISEDRNGTVDIRLAGNTLRIPEGAFPELIGSMMPDLAPEPVEAPGRRNYDITEESFTQIGWPADRARAAAWTYDSLVRQGADPSWAIEWIMDGQRHGGGLAKLIEQGMPPTPASVDGAAFAAAGMGTQAAGVANEAYLAMRPQMQPTQAWQAVFGTYLQGYANGGHAGGLQALEALRAEVTAPAAASAGQAGDPAPAASAQPAGTQSAAPADVQRIAQFAYTRYVQDGHEPADAAQWVNDAYRSGGKAALIERATPAVPNAVTREVFQQSGMGSQAASLANEAYLAQRQFGTSPQQAWEATWTAYLQGLGSGGSAGAVERLSELLARV
ncbi:hypothetical protein [Futiania mangrovi]|uniref:Uncharacterized protein n=1 Tax=Futiania mangrovi TaxID=2959716 RepID=A0A9J6PAR2_9PROT|nr:hypothetical protein [Futiania mangrovii]MCP1336197.1 hypothetical protein [Futiania mangrovii]